MSSELRQETIQISCFISEEEEGTFVEVPFELPANVDEIYIQMDVQEKKDSGTTIDLGIRDQYRVRGWSGGARNHFEIGKERATPGYLAGDLAEGGWAVLLGAYQVPSNGCQVELQLTLTFESPRWLKGDLHGHSVHSDGSYTLNEIAEIAIKQGLDFVGLMDHNTSSQNIAYPKDTPVLFIPGMELTTYRGHCNLFGAIEPVLDFRIPDSDTLANVLRETREKGSYISINHPHNLSCPSCSWQWGWEIDYDWVEVWNGPWNPYNLNTLNWWQEQLMSGKRLVAVGGSDTHRQHPYVKHGSPTNWVNSCSRSVKGILAAIHRGHVSISYCPNGPQIELKFGSFGMGDIVAADQKSTVCFEAVIDDLQATDQIKVISNFGIEQQVDCKEEGEFKLNFAVGEQIFLRVEVWRYFAEVDQYLMASMTNPIYFDAN
ncbi:MAG: phosphoesterase domain protein [Bacilli bacterium]|nr:phosphoesterase domain protein [Bacilli bacterium]